MNAIPEFLRHTARTIDKWRQELELYFEILPRGTFPPEQIPTMRQAMTVKAAHLRLVARELECSKQGEAA
ncbi:MAG: hypothetical protein A2Y75_01580 [Candidatus Solincola sediminis]|uniref:Uncharacterized protein n=1 Tax=Candidatus Solincola sediminis TaxID=1797199 RepID=A0A1F2WNI7_9ACTN|nr:MAG: hypothetical protein A2Y75_01580 [Candidatus Solincola sediminis]